LIEWSDDMTVILLKNRPGSECQITNLGTLRRLL